MQDTTNIDMAKILIRNDVLVIGFVNSKYLANYIEVSFKINKLPKTVPTTLNID